MCAYAYVLTLRKQKEINIEMKIELQIQTAAIEAVKALYGQDVPAQMIQLQKTRPDFEGNLTLVTFPLLKTSRKKPEDTGADLGEYLVKNCPAVSGYNVVKGFLNLVVAQEAFIAQRYQCR